MIALSPYALLIYGQLLSSYYILKLFFNVLLSPANEEIVRDVDISSERTSNNILYRNSTSASLANRPISLNTYIIKVDTLYSWRNKKEIRASIDTIQVWTESLKVPSLTPCANFKIICLDDENLSREVLIKLLSKYRKERLNALIDYIYEKNISYRFKNDNSYSLEKALTTLLLESFNDVSEEFLATNLLSSILPISRGTHAYDFILACLKNKDFINSITTSKCILRNSAVKLAPIYNFKLPTTTSSIYFHIFPYSIKSKEIIEPTVIEIKRLEKHIWNIRSLFNTNTFHGISNLKFHVMNNKLIIQQ